jgi:signal transduction histidine kinase
MTDAEDSGEVTRLRRWLERERRARAESEQIAEKALRDLYLSNAALERQAIELRIKNAELDSFVSSISHDLKAPLVAANGMAGALAEGYGPHLDAQGRHYLERLQANVTLMESLVSDLRTLTWIGRETQAFEAVELAEVVTTVLDELAEPIRARGLEVVVTATGTLWGVRREVQWVLTHLVTNAVSYLGDTPTPRVEIGSVAVDGVVECHVRDNGIGIDPAYHARIFETFQRLKDVPGDGSGFGLAIVRKIVAGVGGRAWVESSRGQGATFRFTWPAATSAA